MTEEESRATLASLQQGATALRDVLNGVSEAMAQRAPALGRWSIQQVVEHIALTEDFLLASIASASKASAPILNPGREARIMARGADRSRPVEAPEAVLPRGRFSSAGEALRHFLDRREKTLHYAASHLDQDLRCLVTSHPIFGEVNAFEVLLLMAVHVQRHVGQIVEIRAELS